jgi:dual specificity MAP kinase phosphatase
MAPQCVDDQKDPTSSESSLALIASTSSSVEGSSVDSNDLKMIMPRVLADLLSADSLVTTFVLDCRPFLAFNANHVVGAFNVCCFNSVTRKRLQDEKIDVVDVISGQDGKELYQKAQVDPHAEIVLYDDGTTDMSALPVTHVLKVITGCLEKKGKRSRFIHGGMQAVQRTVSSICTQPDPNAVPLLFSPTSPGEISCDIDNATASEILPFLFIGNERDASNRARLTELGITHIVNVTAHLPLHFDSDGIEYLRLPASDSGNQNLKQFFAKANEFIEAARLANGRVLVHCQAGVSRSPTIVMAYMMSTTQKTLTDTFATVKDRRSIVAPNLNFMGQLLELEQQCGPRAGLCPPSEPIHLLRL